MTSPIRRLLDIKINYFHESHAPKRQIHNQTILRLAHDIVMGNYNMSQKRCALRHICLVLGREQPITEYSVHDYINKALHKK